MKRWHPNVQSSVEDIALVLKAFKFAAFKHRDQRRKDERASPYINHPIVVAEMLLDIGGIREATTLVAGILHDIVEDTDTSPEELEREFGQEVCRIVLELTDDKALPKSVRKRLQLENVGKHSLRARQVRLADKISNLEDLIHSPPAGWSRERKKEYVGWARKVVDGLRGVNEALERHFDRVFEQATRELEKEKRAGP